ncbi:MAG TPA: metal ABC transporter permease [Chthoniobacteraceae bacterium]|nr:metal ABC transporter permease [Chthoniobacteraceae bacterium]
MEWLLEFLDLPQMRYAFYVALIAGPLGGLLGSFITLRGMAFFSDAISHGAMTGVTLGFALTLARDLNDPMMQLIVSLFCVAMALLMAWLLERTTLQTDTIIAFTYTGSVALGMIMISRLRGSQGLEGALFGDILASSAGDVWLMAGLAVLTCGFLFFNLRPLTLAVVQENLARVEGFNTRRLNYAFVVLVALVIALLLRQLGALLISGLIVVPAAAARVIAPNFRFMLAASAVIGLVGAALGVFGSYHLDTPTGPTMVLSDVALLTGCLLVSAGASLCRRRQLRKARG